MKTLRKMKKGFTIVELVIVIAVIAILTAILVPTFISISNKADKASDESLKNYLNKALAIVENDRELNMNGDNKGKTMHFAVEDLDEYGITLDKIVTKSDEKLVWNSADNRFYFESEAPAAVTERYGYWRIQTNGNDADGYAIYAGKNFAETNGVVNVHVGFDAGYNENIEQINYTNTGSQKRTVAIRSNGTSTTLTVNAPLDTVHHYDYLDELTVTAVDPNNSYHEHGTVKGKAVINSGHFVVEDEADVSQVSVESATGAVKVTANAETTIVVDSASESSTTVVANSNEVFVSGDVTVSGSQASSVVTATLVTTWAQLQEVGAATKGFAKLGANISNAQLLEISKGHTFKLDLNGHTLSTIESSTGRHYYALDNYGEVEIFDSSANQAGEIRARGIENIGGKMTIQSGNFYNVDTNGGAAIWSESENASDDSNYYVLKRDVDFAKSHDQNYYDTDLGVTISNGGYIVVDDLLDDFVWVACDHNASESIIVPVYQRMNVTSVAELTINGGTFNVEYTGSSSDSAGPGVLNLQLKTKTVINGGTFETNSNRTYAIISNGDLVINDANVISHGHGALSVSAGSTVVNNGTFSATNYYGLYVAGEYGAASCVINGGTFSSASQVAAHIGNSNRTGDGGIGATASVQIFDGTFLGNASKGAINVAYKGDFGLGKAFIYGGVYSSQINNEYIMPGHSCVANPDGTYSVK